MKFSLIIPLAPDRDAPIIESIKKLDYSKNDFHVVVMKGKNPSMNRNRGAEKAKGDILVFLDDDAIIDEDYLKQVDAFFNQYPDVDIVGGPQLTPNTDSGFAKYSGYVLSSIFGAWKVSNRYSGKKIVLNANETHLTSSNLICKKSVMEKIQFDPSLFPGEDPKFISDAKKEKLKIAYNPNIKIYHQRRKTIKQFFRQNFNYGKVRPQKEKFRDTIKTPFFLIPSIFVIYILALIISLFFINNILIWIPLILYLILLVGFSIYESIKNKNTFAILPLLFIFPLIHISYGLGIIWGYIQRK